MYEIACTLDLPPETQQIVRNERKFPITSLERIYMNPRARELLGIHFNDDGRVIGRVKKNEFTHAYKRIVSDIVHDRSDSRELDTAADIEQYMRGIGKDLPNTSVPGRFNIKTFVPTSKLPAPTSKQQRKKRPAAPRTSRTFIPPNMKCTLTQQKIQRIYKELRQIPVGRFPSAAAVLFRSFLQMSLATYVKEHGDMSKVKARNAGVPTLGELMEHLGDQKNPLLPDKSLRAVLRKAISQKNMITSLDTMNAFAHNEALIVTEQSARETWAYFEPLMEVILLTNEKDWG